MSYLLPYLEFIPHFASAIFVIDLIIILGTLPWILAIKKESNAAVAWCLIVILLPIFGSLLFVVFGYSQVHRPVRKKRKHRVRYHQHRHGMPDPRQPVVPAKSTYLELGHIAMKLGSGPVVSGNQVTIYKETADAFQGMLDAIAAAKHHVHVAFFILRCDKTGARLFDLLYEKARQGVEIRLLYDAMGCYRLKRKPLQKLRKLGGQAQAFFPLNILRRRVQVNPRMHRKIVIVDGRVGFTGGMNVGDEYLGLDPSFGYWRDDWARVEGPGVEGLQYVFAEDWDFASEESLEGEKYFPPVQPVGDDVVQVIASGPDQDVNSIRELIFTSITLAKERFWIATPYVVPDLGILDALRSAARAGIDVRIFTLHKPDHYLPYYAAHYYFPDLLEAGVKIYQYRKGNTHAKYCVVDGQWGWLGSSNLDNRSLRLSFEANLILHSPARVEELAAIFEKDLGSCSRLTTKDFAQRSFFRRLLENTARLFSPAL